MTETKEGKNMGGEKDPAPQAVAEQLITKGPAVEQLKSPENVEKLTFALLDKIFESCPSLLDDLKSRVEKEVS